MKVQADERNKYDLVAVGSNSFAYTLKGGPVDSLQRYYLCLGYWNSGRKRVFSVCPGEVRFLDAETARRARKAPSCLLNWRRTSSALLTKPVAVIAVTTD